jgi:hypothetical protein
MDYRNVIKVQKSYYVNIPHKMCEALEIKKGERLGVSCVSGVGVFLMKSREGEFSSVDFSNIERLQKLATDTVSRTEERFKHLSDEFISKLMVRLVPALATVGIFDLKKRVDVLSKNMEQSKKGKGKLISLRDRKKGAR